MLASWFRGRPDRDATSEHRSIDTSSTDPKSPRSSHTDARLRRPDAADRVVRTEMISRREISGDELRKKIASGELDVQSMTKYRFQGPDGTVQEFDSLEEMPPELRAQFEEAKRNLERQR